MVRAVFTGLIIVVCVTEMSFAQPPDSTLLSVDSAEFNDAEILDYLNDAPNPDIANEQVQSILDERGAIDRLRSKNQSTVDLRTRAVIDPDAANSDDYQRGYYRGSPLKTTTALAIRSQLFEASVVEAKDPGEPLFLDHVVASLSTREPIMLGGVHVDRLIVGSYSIRYANGLAFSGGHPQFASASNVTSMTSTAGGLKPYHSISSFRYYNGVATTLSTGNVSLDMFFSDHAIDASIDSQKIVFISQTGYHRTTTELDRRSTAKQTVFGGALQYAVPGPERSPLALGVIAYRMNYDHEVSLADTTTFAFNGTTMSMISAYAQLKSSSVRLAAEVASSVIGSKISSATAINATITASNDLNFGVNVHWLPTMFHSPFGGTFGYRSDNAQNERGGYLGASWRANDHLRLFGYAILSFNESDPYPPSTTQRTVESRVGADYKLNATELGAQVRYLYAAPVAHSISECRLQLEQRLSRRFSIRVVGRWRMVGDSVSTSDGYALSFGARYQPLAPISVALAVEPYRTSTFDSRLFSFEPDLSGVAPFVQLYGVGTRYKLVVAYQGGEWLRAEAVFGESIYAYPVDADTQRKTSIGFQLSLRL